MAASTTTGFGVSISAIDNATKTIDRINKQLSGLSAPAEKFNKAASRFGDVSGLNKLTEGMGALGSKSLDTFRSLDRVAPMLASITGAASLAGMSALIERWAKLGQQTAIASQRLGVSSDRLTALQGAARLAGSSAEDLTSGLGQLDEKLRGATFNRDPQAIQTFNALHVAFKNADGSARDAGSAFGDVADSIKKLNDEQGRGAALRAAQNLGIEPLFALLLKGRKGIQELQAEAEKHGIVISPEAAKQGGDLAKSITGATESIEGLGNTIAKDLEPALKPVIDDFSHWLDTNRDLIGVDVAGWIKSITDAASNMNKNHLWVLLGAALGFKVGGLKGAVIGAGIGYSYERSQEDMGPAGPGANEYAAPGTSVPWNPLNWLLGKHNAGSGSGGGAGNGSGMTVPAQGSAGYDIMKKTHDFWRSKGFSEEQTAGILANIAAESAFNPDSQGDLDEHGNPTSIGLYQEHADRRAALIARYGPNPTADQQNQFAYDELSAPGMRDTNAALHQARNANEAAGIFTTGFERPSSDRAAADRGAAASRFVGAADGTVAVTVTLKGAPTGTTAAAAATGKASVAPPRVETAMPYAGAS
jgi:hypothetical protein